MPQNVPDSLTAPRARLTGLDGLRGVAALVVVVHHCFLTNARFDLADSAPGGNPFGSQTWWWANTPLHLVWEGAEAVFVFFVLSGFVLLLPFVDRLREHRRSDWRGYYAHRLVRLYVPAWAALALALAVIAVFGRHTDPAASGWLNKHADRPHGVMAALHAAWLVTGFNWVNSVLWSLKWEVLFSLALPLFLFSAIRLRRWWPAKLVLAFVLEYRGFDHGNAALMFLPMFWVGCMFAAHHREVGAAVAHWRSRTWLAITVVALIGLNAFWLSQAGTSGVPRSAIVASRVISHGGAALLVFVAAYWRASGLSTAPILWLGKRSFSLYLVHEPIVTSLAMVFRGINLALLIGIAVPISLLVAEVFGRLIEQPSHRLARRIGRLAGHAPSPRGLSILAAVSN